MRLADESEAGALEAGLAKWRREWLGAGRWPVRHAARMELLAELTWRRDVDPTE